MGGLLGTFCVCGLWIVVALRDWMLRCGLENALSWEEAYVIRILREWGSDMFVECGTNRYRSKTLWMGSQALFQFGERGLYM